MILLDENAIRINNGPLIHVTPRCAELLSILHKHSPFCTTYNSIRLGMQGLWGEDLTDKTIGVYIHLIRRKLKRAGGSWYIRSIAKKGWALRPSNIKGIEE